MKPGCVVATSLGNVAVTIYRPAGGEMPVALAGKCAHMGCDLRNGKVAGDDLICPLHHRRIASDGQFLGPGGKPYAELRQRQLPVCERWGAIFVFAGDVATMELPLPSIASASDMATACMGQKSFADQPWWALVGNGLDVEHLEAVHDRKLLEPAKSQRVDGAHLRLTYRTAPKGHNLGDRIMRRLAANGVQGRITSIGGSLMMVETVLDRRESFILLSIAPHGEGGSLIRGVVGVRPGGPFSAWIAGKLFRSFLDKDLAILDGYEATEPISANTTGDAFTREFFSFAREQADFLARETGALS